jgi:Holliday junction resolvase RusA-like endonuclease
MQYPQKLTFRILGTPGHKQSARFTSIGGKIRSFQPNEVVKNQNTIKSVIMGQLPENFIPYGGPIKVTYDFIYMPLKSFSKKLLNRIESGEVIYKTTKPDTDNLIKMHKDAMNNMVYIDDAQVCVERPSKYFGINPMTIITVYFIPKQI